MPRRPDAPPVSRASETFAVGGSARWLDFLELEHGTQPPLDGCALEGERVRVTRAAISGRPLGEGRVPRPFAPALLLQAAAAAAFFAERGFPLDVEDLDDAVWDAADGAGLLWIPRSPRRVEEEPARGRAGLPEVVRRCLDRLFGRSGRLQTEPARELARSLEAAEAPSRRPAFWPAAVLRAFPELASPAAAAARRRCLGAANGSLRPWRVRAWLAVARAALAGSRARLFGLEGSPLEPASALGLDPSPASASEGARRLLELAAAPAGARPTWIAAAKDSWDSLSRRAFEAALVRVGGAVELVEVASAEAPPDGPDAWRRALWLPLGSVSASVRFFEWLADRAPRTGSEGREHAADFLASGGFARFATDPTGHAPLPPPALLGPGPRSEAPPSAAPATPGERIAAALADGEVGRALELARAWVGGGGAGPEAWFSLSAALSARTGGRVVPWLDLLEAEREAAGGLAAEARRRLDRVAAHPESSREERRRARIRAAELSVRLGEHAAASRRAAAWRRDHPDAPAAETARALRLGAEGLAREGRTDCALALLDEAEVSAGSLPLGDRLDLSLARAHVSGLAGRFEEEDRIYAAWRAAALGSGDERLVARFLAQEARGLLDRRDFSRAALRFEEALGAADDAAERAALSIDLAATRYHAGDREGSEQALEEALANAAAAGREDLARLARGNRIELLLDRCAFDAAQTEIAVEHAEAVRSADDRRRLVALHHRARLALRRGELEAARRDNAAARALAESLGDRLEIGELWLEDGDRAACAGDREGARRAWEKAANDPPDRCDTDRLARERLSEVAGGEGPPPGPAEALEDRFDDDPAGAAEAVARWCGFFGADRVPATLRERAGRVFVRLGAAPLAALVGGARAAAPPSDSALRALRGAVAGVLAGDGAGAERALPLLGLSGLRLREPGGRELLRLEVSGSPATDAERWRPLEAGAARFELGLRPEVPEETVAAVALVLESLLHRVPLPAAAVSDFEEGWRRLGLVTGDASMEEPWRRLARFAPQGVTVLVLGESGSGKEAVARAVHRLSPRAGGPFVPVNVPAIPAALAESELFGHARGAFSGADRDRRGLLEEAHGGTVFFDEIGDLSPPLQSKLLRALQEREVRRLGENRSRPVDVRIVSATSRELEKEVEAGRFREDLFYRLHVACVRLPALRERGRDALLLARHFLERFAREYGRGPLRLAPESAAAILEYAWPGNVRELENAMAQAAALSDGAGPFGPELLPSAVRGARRSAAPRGDYRASVDAHRRDLIAGALERSGGNRSRAARELGLSRQALLYLIKELKVDAGRS